MKLNITLGLETEEGEEVPTLLITLLQNVRVVGSLAAAAEQSGVSYRTAWNLINSWSDRFSEDLLETVRGRGAKTTAFGNTLLWASSQSRLKLGESCSQVEKQINRAFLPFRNPPGHDSILMYASDCSSLEVFRNLYKAESGDDIDIVTSGSGIGLQVLAKGDCQIAGFHIADSIVKDYFVDTYRANINPEDIVLLKIVSREQGMIVAAGNPLEMRQVTDLLTVGVRMINRQSGAGTRVLLDALLQANNIDPGSIQGYGDEESTHSAVCARIAGNMADVALGTRASAMSYGLGFIPLLEESYFFAFRHKDISEHLRINALFSRMQTILCGEPWRNAMAALDGYRAVDVGKKLQGSLVLRKATP